MRPTQQPYPLYLVRRPLLLLAVLAGWVASTSGCACGINIVQTANSSHQNTHAGGNKADQSQPPPTRQTTQRPSRYQIRGVTMVAFYPGSTDKSRPHLDASTGSMNGYAIFWNKPQETVISAWAMRDGECQFETSKHENKQEPDKELRGLDGGKTLSVRLGGETIALEQRVNSSNSSSPHVIYNIPTTDNYLFPYNQEVIFTSDGAKELQTFQVQLKAPAQVTVTQPRLHEEGIQLPRNKDFTIRWHAKGPMEYLAVRLNQELHDKKESRSLFCRFANTGEASIPVNQLQKLTVDPEGAFTSIYVLSTTYKLAQVPGFSDPILSVVRATSTVAVKVF